jgi:hypothetical protein
MIFSCWSKFIDKYIVLLKPTQKGLPTIDWIFDQISQAKSIEQRHKRRIDFFRCRRFRFE